MESLEQIRREHILEVLRLTDWDVKKACEILKVSETYLRKEIQQLGRLKRKKLHKKSH